MKKNRIRKYYSCEVRMNEVKKIKSLITLMTALMLIVGGFLLFCQGGAKEESDHQVTGTFTVNGKAFPLKYIYTWYDSSLFDDTQKDLMLLFSNKPVPEDADIPFDLADLGRKGKIHAIEVRYSKSEEGVVGGSIYHEAFGDMMVAFSGKSRITAEFSLFDEESAEGKIYTCEPQESFDGKKWEVEAEFTTILKKEEK
jgi:hypothetical protein